MIGMTAKRHQIPELYRETYNPGNWNSGHVSLEHHVVLFVTLQGGEYDKQGDRGGRFRWTSQNSCKPDSKKGREIVSAGSRGAKTVDLWTRARRSDVAFTYRGAVKYDAHTGSAPMRVWFVLR